MKVVKIQTHNQWDELTTGKIYEAVPRTETLAPYVNPYVWSGSLISQKLKDDAQYYLIAKTDKGTTKYFYPVFEFEPIEKIREEKLNNLLSL